MIVRIGTFLILVGLALLIVFIGSIMGKDTNGIYLLLSFATIFLGFMLRRNRTIRESGRFGAIRRASEHSRQRREERMNNKHQRGGTPGNSRQMQHTGRKNENKEKREEDSDE